MTDCRLTAENRNFPVDLYVRCSVSYTFNILFKKYLCGIILEFNRNSLLFVKKKKTIHSKYIRVDVHTHKISVCESYLNVINTLPI